MCQGNVSPYLGCGMPDGNIAPARKASMKYLCLDVMEVTGKEGRGWERVGGESGYGTEVIALGGRRYEENHLHTLRVRLCALSLYSYFSFRAIEKLIIFLE